MVNKTTEYSTLSSESVVVVVLASSSSRESLLVENSSVPYTLDNFSTSPNLSHFTPDCYKQMMHKTIRACYHLNNCLKYWKFHKMLYNSKWKSDRLINTQSRVLQADGLILENNEMATLNIIMPYHGKFFLQQGAYNLSFGQIICYAVEYPSLSRCYCNATWTWIITTTTMKKALLMSCMTPLLHFWIGSHTMAWTSISLGCSYPLIG